MAQIEKKEFEAKKRAHLRHVLVATHRALHEAEPLELPFEEVEGKEPELCELLSPV